MTVSTAVRGEHPLGPHDFMMWSTNYTYTSPETPESFPEDHSMAFDLLFFVDNGQPVLVVINRGV